MGSATCPHYTASLITSRPPHPDFPGWIDGLPAWHRDFHHPAGLPFGVPPSLHVFGTGILTCCPSPTAFALGLGPTNPTRNDLPSEPLGIRRMRFARILRYSYRHSHFPALHCSSRYSFEAQGTLPYRGGPKTAPRGFGGVLEPRYIFGAGTLDQ